MHSSRTMSCILASLSIAVAGCLDVAAPGKALDTADQFFATIATGDIDRALSLYDERFFEVTARDDWRQFLEQCRELLGEFRSHELQSWKKTKWIATAGSGTYFTLTYTVHYSNGIATETLLLFTPPGRDTIGIIGHLIKSEDAGIHAGLDSASRRQLLRVA